MELALYCPLYGYYEKKRDTTGKRGDFYTSVSVGSLFGELLAFQFAAWFTAAVPGGATRLRLAEAGAHDGRLARDILTWFKRQRPALFEHMEYLILEPSERRQSWQEAELKEFGGKISWQRDFNHEPASVWPCYTILFSNELLDAFPVHRLGWDAGAKAWFEWGVTLADERFAWTRLPVPTCELKPLLDLPAELLAVLPDGFTTELGPAGEKWWHAAANWLRHGKLLALDYGLAAEDFFSPQRAHGTLRAYRHHQLTGNLLADPGEQDLTAHVNFSALGHAGESVGLTTESFTSQAQFLTRIVEQAWQEKNNFGLWTPEHSRQFQTLTHPNHLGRAFRVLVQSR